MNFTVKSGRCGRHKNNCCKGRMGEQKPPSDELPWSLWLLPSRPDFGPTDRLHLLCHHARNYDCKSSHLHSHSLWECKCQGENYISSLSLKGREGKGGRTKRDSGQQPIAARSKVMVTSVRSFNVSPTGGQGLSGLGQEWKSSDAGL